MGLIQSSYPEDLPISKSKLSSLKKYQAELLRIIIDGDDTRPEFTLAIRQLDAALEIAQSLKKDFKSIKHLILVGIGGSDLGTQAIYEAAGGAGVYLHCINVISPFSIEKLMVGLSKVKKADKIAVCVISKSGKTTETIANAAVVLSLLKKQFTKDIYRQTVFIGNPNTDLIVWGKKLKVKIVPMPEAVGGRFSVSTTVGLVPLAILGFLVTDFVKGLKAAITDEALQTSLYRAQILSFYLKHGYQHYNFFAFNTRLEKLGAWYRQLLAESLGKEFDRSGRLVKRSFLPTISTPAELHSVGQLYFSGVNKVYTDFVKLDDEIDFSLPKIDILKDFEVKSLSAVGDAIYNGVLEAYQSKGLPYSTTILTVKSLHDLGLFMGSRMLEIMFLAEFMNINAFDQPNVELYKENTKRILKS